MLGEENLIPGVKITFVTYDTGLDYTRVAPGCVLLKSQRAIVLQIMDSVDKWEYLA
jgi:hypothetical protein